MTRDNIAPIAEEIIIEQQTVEELREQITNLQNELAEQKRHADKMDELTWENLKTKEKLEKELEEEKIEKERIQKELGAKNQIIDDLQKELNKEKGWWDKWMNDKNSFISGFFEWHNPGFPIIIKGPQNIGFNDYETDSYGNMIPTKNAVLVLRGLNIKLCYRCNPVYSNFHQKVWDEFLGKYTDSKKIIPEIKKYYEYYKDK